MPTLSSGVKVDLIDSFVDRYGREFDFYEQAGRLAARRLEAALESEGIRAIVTSRAKSGTRLEAKLRQRSLKNEYLSIEDIYDDIVDLAGVRVALYFPGEREQVGRLVSRLFTEYDSRREFPSADKTREDKRFSGYSATHYRVQLRQAELEEADARFASAHIEIQVASVLMHAWAEVEHDLVYKPLEGALSPQEYQLLDQLNGLVLSGEIALEQLQIAGDARVAQTDRKFGNHYELAAHLISLASSLRLEEVSDSGMGRMDALHKLLKTLGMDTPEGLEPYVESLHGDLERRPLAEQIIDALLQEDDSRYGAYELIRQDFAPRPAESPTDDGHNAIGRFLTQWIRLERVLREFVPGEERPVPLIRALDLLPFLDSETRFEVNQLRRLRNTVVHGIETPHPAQLNEAADRLGEITSQLERQRWSELQRP